MVDWTVQVAPKDAQQIFMKIAGRGFDSRLLHMNRRQYLEHQIEQKLNYIEQNRKELPLYQDHVDRRVIEIERLNAEIEALKKLLSNE